MKCFELFDLPLSAPSSRALQAAKVGVRRRAGTPPTVGRPRTVARPRRTKLGPRQPHRSPARGTAEGALPASRHLHGLLRCDVPHPQRIGIQMVFCICSSYFPYACFFCLCHGIVGVRFVAPNVAPSPGANYRPSADCPHRRIF